MCLLRQLLMSCRLRSPQSERCHCCAQPHRPCPSLGMGNPPETPAHPTLVFCFYWARGGCRGRAGAAGGRGHGECPPEPTPQPGHTRSSLPHQGCRWGPQCHRGGITGRPGCPCPHPLAPWGYEPRMGLHVSPPAPPTGGWGLPASPGPHTHSGTAMGTVREGRAAEGAVPGTPSSTYEQGDQHKPPAGLGPVQLQDPPPPRYFFTLMREW